MVVMVLKKYLKHMIITLLILFIHAYLVIGIPNKLSDIIDIGIYNYGINDNNPKVIRQKILDNILKYESDSNKLKVLNNYKLIQKKDLSKDEYRSLIKKYPLLIQENIYVLINNENIKDVIKNKITSWTKTNSWTINENYSDNETNKLYNQFIINEYETVGLSIKNIQTNYIIKNTLYMLISIILITILTFLITYINKKTSSKITTFLNNKIISKIKALNDSSLNDYNKYFYLENFDNDINIIKNITKYIFFIIYLLILIILIIITLLNKSVIISLIFFLILIILNLILIIIIKKNGQKKYLNHNHNLSQKQNINNIIKNIYTYKKYPNKINYEIPNISSYNKGQPKLILTSFLLIIIIISLNISSIGLSFQIVLYAIILAELYKIFLENIDEITSILIAIFKINKLLRIKTIKNNDLKFNNKGIIQFKNVSSTILKNINLTIKGVVAIKGHESFELISYIIKEKNIKKGTIIINGVDIKKINIEKLYKIIGIVHDNSRVLNNSLLYNLTLGKNISNQLLDEVCKVVEIEDFVNEKPERYNFIIENNISEKEKQKIIIAREILKNPDILIFNKSLNNINVNTIQNIIKYLEGKTIVLVTDNLKELKLINNIIQVKNGSVIKSNSSPQESEEKQW